jgi:hypothetical protein
MSTGVLRHSTRDGLLVTLAAGHGALLLTVPSVPLIAIGIWWNANTIAHNFIHLPFFRSRRTNALFSAYLSLLLGVPQTIWRDRHLAHHAGRPWRFRWSRRMAAEIVIVVAFWATIALRGHDLLVMWAAGWIGGMLLCQLQGHFEHARGTVSHYGTPYNLLFFNDGYHAEHHAHPAAHWSTLPRYADHAAPQSRWPAVLRWLESNPLDLCEQLVLRSRTLQRLVVQRHERAFRRLLAELPPVKRVTIVGGGIFPRSALVLRRLLPTAEITIIDRSADNLRSANSFLGSDIRVLTAEYSPAHGEGSDLLVVPLAFEGDRSQFYDAPPARAVAVHDWLWRSRGAASTVVSLLLLKRLNLVVR